MLGNRHGNYVEDKRSLQNIYKEKEKDRVKISVQKEDFVNMDEFNNTFNKRKTNGYYNNMIIKKTSEIQPFTFKGSNLAELKDFDKVYINDNQYKYAFELLPSDEKLINHKNIKEGIDNYNKTTQSLNNIKKMNFNDLNI